MTKPAEEVTDTCLSSRCQPSNTECPQLISIRMCFRCPSLLACRVAIYDLLFMSFSVTWRLPRILRCSRPRRLRAAFLSTSTLPTSLLSPYTLPTSLRCRTALSSDKGRRWSRQGCEDGARPRSHLSGSSFDRSRSVSAELPCLSGQEAELQEGPTCCESCTLQNGGRCTCDALNAEASSAPTPSGPSMDTKQACETLETHLPLPQFPESLSRAEQFTSV